MNLSLRGTRQMLRALNVEGGEGRHLTLVAVCELKSSLAGKSWNPDPACYCYSQRSGWRCEDDDAHSGREQQERLAVVPKVIGSGGLCTVTCDCTEAGQH
jgi:hypothetical protein